MTGHQDIVKVECLRHVYPDSTEVNICGLDFVISKGQRVVILGPNGSGKTTLLLHLMGLLGAVEGNVEVFGKDPMKNFNDIKKRIGVVFQNVDEQIIAPTVWEDVTFTPRSYGLPKDATDRMGNEVLEEMNITHLRDKIPHYLSGGERKKVALAGALITKPDLLIMDEPFNGLDPRSKHEMMALLDKYNRSYGTTVVVTTHDINIVPALADYVYVINNGNILFGGYPLETFTNKMVLEQANLEPPILVELIDALHQRGIKLEPTFSIADVASEIAEMNREKSRIAEPRA